MADFFEYFSEYNLYLCILKHRYVHFYQKTENKVDEHLII